MSARALRKLREDRAVSTLPSAEEEEEESESESESESEEAPVQPKKSAFAMMNDSSSSSEEEEEEDEEEEEEEEESGKEEEEAAAAPDLKEEQEEEEETAKEENLDALLEEFKEQDDKKQSASTDDTAEGSQQAALVPVLLDGIDPRELDVDYILRTALVSAEPATNSTPASNNRRRNRQKASFWFGTPQNLNIHNNAKPPHFVGGGMGMSTYDRDTESHKTIPWPYSTREGMDDRKRWYTFGHSDSYDKDCTDFQVIKNSGDTNGLVWFVVHHPFVTKALLTLSTMLYQLNQAQEGLTFLRRALWVYESATVAGFTARVLEDQCFMDGTLPENQTYFDALFQLARVNNIAGLPRSSFAIARYLLSLDPLRDPKGTLLVLDSYAMSVQQDASDQWLKDLYKNNKIQLYYQDEECEAEYQCQLSDFPNWAYSYALSLFRLNDSQPSPEANQALQTAISRFPTVVDLLLSENDIDPTSRSCRLDWQAVLDYTGSRSNAVYASPAMDQMDPVVRMATEKAYDSIIRILAKLNHKLWASDAVLLWIHNNLVELKKTNVAEVEEWKEVAPLSPALMKYSTIDPSEYEMKIQLLPAEALQIDPGVVQHALVIDPNRGRLLRNQQRRNQNNNQDMMDEFLFGGNNAVRPRPALLGPPRNVIDLDWPMLEIFWRSLLPWNRIEEIPRPRP